MRVRPFRLLLPALLGACTGGDPVDTAPVDTAPGDTAGPAFTLVDFSGFCRDGACRYTLVTSGAADSLELRIADAASGASEVHEGFALTETRTDGANIHTISLAWVTSDAEQVDGVSTAFNEAAGGEGWDDGLTWMFSAAADGASDCLVIGENPELYAADCTRVVEGSL